MPIWDAKSSRHVVPSHVGHANALLVDTNYFPGLFVMFPDYALRTSLGTFSILLKAGPLRLKQLTNTLKIRILAETSILDLIRYASIILIFGLRMQRPLQTSEDCWKKNSGMERVRTSIIQQSLDHRSDALPYALLRRYEVLDLT